MPFSSKYPSLGHTLPLRIPQVLHSHVLHIAGECERLCVTHDDEYVLHILNKVCEGLDNIPWQFHSHVLHMTSHYLTLTPMHFVRATDLATRKLVWVSVTSGTNFTADAVTIARYGRVAHSNWFTHYLTLCVHYLLSSVSVALCWCLPVSSVYRSNPHRIGDIVSWCLAYSQHHLLVGQLLSMSWQIAVHGDIIGWQIAVNHKRRAGGYIP